MSSSARASAVGQLLGILAPGARHRRPPAAASADDRGGLAQDVRRAHALGHGRVEVRDQVNLAVLLRSENDRGRRVLLLVAIGELEERVGVEAFDRLDDDVDAAFDSDVRIGNLDALLRAAAAFGAFRSFSTSPRSDSSSRARSSRIAHAAPDVTASTRRTPEPTELSDRRTNGPISALDATCVPPQSSTE